MKYNDCVESVNTAVEKLREAEKALQQGPASYCLKQLAEYADLLFSRFAPFKPGDRVEIVNAPKLNDKDAPGWMGSKHILNRGAVGTVHEVDVRHGKFCASVAFDRNTYINMKGEEVQSDCAAPLFWLSETTIATF